MRVFEVNPEDFLPQWGWLQWLHIHTLKCHFIRHGLILLLCSGCVVHIQN
jgi:hypothetical protein